MPYVNMLFLVLSLPFLFGGCVSLKQPSLHIESYTLEYGALNINNLKPLSIVIRTERFGVAPLYNTNQIVFRDASFKRNVYYYHKWQVNPGDLVAHFLARDMRQSGLFKAVLSPEIRYQAPYTVNGTVDEFFEWDNEKTWEAVLSVTIILIAENNLDASNRILLQKTYQSRQACKQKNPSGLAEAMSRAMANVSGTIIEDVYGVLQDCDPTAAKSP